MNLIDLRKNVIEMRDNARRIGLDMDAVRFNAYLDMLDYLIPKMSKFDKRYDDQEEVTRFEQAIDLANKE